MKPTLETHKVMVNHIISASGMSYNATEDSLKGTLQETDATGASLTKGRNVWNDQWYIFIPAASLNADNVRARTSFLDAVKDIHFNIKTYSMSGN